MDEFKRRKKQQLMKQDRSTAGKWDNRILKLCNKINKNPDMYTTSSCSGRIVLLYDSLKKKEDLFILRSHELEDWEEIFWILKKLEAKWKERSPGAEEKGIVLFKQEPCILTVACRNMETAGKMLDIARERAGWKNSGIMSLKRNICELRSTEHLALPVMKDGKIIISEDYLKILASEANSRLKATWTKIERLEKLF